MSVDASTQNRLKPSLARLARLAWLLLAGACLTVFVLDVRIAIDEPLPRCTLPESPCPPAVFLSQEDVDLAAELGIPVPFEVLALLSSLVARLSLALVAAIIFWRRSDEWVALVVSSALVTVLVEGTHGLSTAMFGLTTVLLGLGSALFLPIPFVFPSGRFVPGWTRLPALAITAVYTILVFFLSAPFYADASAVVTLAWAVLAVYAMVHRYRRVSPTERQQIKWVLFGMSAALLSGVYFASTVSLFPISQPSPQRLTALMINVPIYAGSYGLFAFSMLVAMLRYRLWDVDVIIRRTLLYTILAGLLALVYFGGVVLLQGILGPLIGSSESPLVTVITTLGIASLFNPLRSRIQDFIDRRFYRQKYNAEQALARFAAAARDEVDLDRLAGAVTGVVQETVRPERVSLWLAEGRGRSGVPSLTAEVVFSPPSPSPGLTSSAAIVRG